MEKPGRTPNFLFLYALWLLVAAIASLLWVNQAMRRPARELRVEAATDARHLAARLRYARLEATGLLKALSRTRDVHDVLQDPAVRRTSLTHPERLRALPAVAALSGRLQEMARDLDSKLLFVVDANGRCVASSDWQAEPSALGQTFADREYVRAGLGGGLGESYLVGRNTGVLGSYFAVPVEAGCLAMQTQAETWAGRMVLGRVPGLVSDETGVVLFSNRPEWNLTLLPGRPALPAELCQDRFRRAALPPLPFTSSGPEEWRDASGQTWLVGQAAIFDSGLKVHVLFSQDHLHAVRRILWTRAAVVALLGWVLLWWLERLWNRMAALRHLSSYDPLTQTLNRRGFEAQGSKEWARARRYRRPLTLLAIDLDHFKSINDQHGHAAGDLVLTSTASLCRAQLRDMDLLARMGGEEFVVLLTETDLAQAQVVAERIRTAVQDQICQIGGVTIPVTVSIGLAEAAPEDRELAEVLRRSDLALYRAKGSGRNRVEL